MTTYLGGRAAAVGDHAAGRATPLPHDAATALELGRAALHAGVPELAGGAWRMRSLHVLHVGKQRGKRIVAYRVGLEDRETGARRVEAVIGKFYGRERGADADAALRALWRAGFRPPARLVVPHPFGWSAEHGALLQGRIDGIAWADHLGASAVALARASGGAARWLARLHGAPIPAEPAPLETDAAEVRRFAAELEAAFPGHADALRIAERVARELLVAPGAPAPSHGDFHPKNVYVDGRRVAVIDFDTFAAREPAWDLGYGVGQLLCMSRFRHGSFDPGLEAARGFLVAYGVRAPEPPWRRVATFLARTLLQSLHYELCTLRNGRLELLDLWPLAIECALDSHELHAFADRIRGC